MPSMASILPKQHVDATILQSHMPNVLIPFEESGFCEFLLVIAILSQTYYVIYILAKIIVY
jgi:hypothetical protein